MIGLYMICACQNRSRSASVLLLGVGGHTLKRAVLRDAAEGGAQLGVPVHLAHARRAPLGGQERRPARAPELVCSMYSTRLSPE